MNNERYLEIRQALDELAALIRGLPDDSPEKETLRDQWNELRRERDRLVDRAINEASGQYQSATSALRTGISDVQAAISSGSNIPGAIAQISAAIEQISDISAG